MLRRHAASVLAATSLIAALPSSYAEEEAPLFPRLDCARQMNDPAGDGKYTLSGSGGTAVNRPSNTSVDALDIRTASLRSNDDILEMYIGVKSLTGAFAAYETAWSWEVKFENSEGAVFTLSHMMVNPQYDNASSLRPSSWQNYPQADYKIGTNGGAKFTGVKHRVETAKGFIIVSVPMSEVQKAFAEPITQGLTEVSKVTATSFAHIPNTGAASQRPADTATSDVKYVFGDEYCFGPPPAALTGLTTPKVQYTDSVKLTATLSSEAGEKLAGKSVQFTVDGEPTLRGTTNAAGVVSVTYKPTKRAGTYPLMVFFPGDETTGKTRLPGTVTVVTEATRFNALAVAKPTTTTRRVTATLVDDDKRAVAGQKVVWYVNGKKATTQTTSSKGQAILTTAKPGQTVHAVFVAVAGKFAGATAKAVRV